MNQSPQVQDNGNSFPASVVYAYPPAGVIDDEISLAVLLSKLVKQWKLMAAIAVGGSLLAVAIALYLTSIYQVQTTLSLPKEADVSPFVSNGLGVGTANAVFKRYYNEVRSVEKFSNYLISKDYLTKLFPGSGASQEILASNMVKSFSVNIDEPLPATIGGLVANPERITISLVHADEPLIAQILSAYVKDVGASLIQSITTEQRIVIGAKIKQLNSKIDILRIREKTKRMAEISRIKEKNSEEIASLQQKIAAVLSKAKQNTKDRLVQILEARSVAESLGIVFPTELKEIKGEDSQQDRLQTLINVNNNDTLPLFLMGTRYLDSLINTIKSRQDEAAFVTEISDFRKQIALLENDARLAALLGRSSDDPYISEVPDIQANIAQLQSLTVDFSDANVYTVESDVLMTGLPVKPNRKVIIVVGVVLSAMLALLVGIVAVSIQRNSEPPAQQQ